MTLCFRYLKMSLKFDIPKRNIKLGWNKKKPYAFTEQGVAMLSGILNSDRAIAVNFRSSYTK